MKILGVSQVKEWDAFTITNEPISSIDLMERASARASSWLLEHHTSAKEFAIFCGPGNNGGDGLAIARMLRSAGKDVLVFLLKAGRQTADNITNLQRLTAAGIPVQQVESINDLPIIPSEAIIVEALYGTGLNRPLEGLPAELVNFINALPNEEVISIDMPGGLMADQATEGVNIIRASQTLCFQNPRTALFFAENEIYCGEWEVLDVGLHPGFEPQSHMEWVLQDSPWLHLNRYRKHSHKGLLGHAMIAAGSIEKMGAAVMASKACLSSGSGLLTMAVPEECFGIIQTSTPEAMCRPQEESANEFFLQQAKINAVGIGPGWQEFEAQSALLEELIVTVKTPLVIDATALYHLSKNPSLLYLRPKGSETILTPHVGEFARLFGSSSNSFQRLETAIEKSKTYNAIIILKGAYSQVITPGGMCYFNSTGNPGMAKGGSGDALTGLLTGLLAQKYPATLACILAVYAHGLAGDIAANKYSQQGMTAMDLVACLPEAWKKLGGV